ncbi:TonB-dependent receptor [soil metagenome]
MGHQSSRLAVPFGAIAALFATQSFAQAPAPAETSTQVQEIVVTGSRIARLDYVSPTPIVTVGAEAIARSGAPTVEAALNQLPQFTPAAGSASSFNARGGQANLNLRALGSQRTMVLVDGRRLQPANADGSADLNIIPPALIENVEIITGGASATYGSDAIAGVVNLKLKRRFEGVQLDAQYGVSAQGDARTKDLAVTMGGDFADERGAAVLSVGYSERDPLAFTRRDYLRNQALSGNMPNGVTLVEASNLPSQAAVNAVFARYGAAPGAVARNTGFGFNADGTLFRAANTIGYTGPTTGIYSSYNGTLYGDTGYFNYAQVPLERYSLLSKIDYNVTSDFKVFGQVLYTTYDATTQGPPPNSSSTLNVLSVPVGNPFIPTDLRGLLASRPNPSAPFTIQKRYDVLGPRTEQNHYDVFQITLGGDGRLPLKDWAWNAYGAFGRTSYRATEVNYPSSIAVQRLLSAADGGASLCAGGFNPFGPQPISAACATYITRTAHNQTTLEQTVLEANVQGGLFDLPAGEVRFAAGADYRKMRYDFSPDALITAGDLANFLPVRGSGGSSDVREIYGELLIPLLANLPLVKEANLDLGYRYSDYDTVGGVSTYKADLDWKIMPSVMLRGGLARAIRAPSVGELYTAATQDAVSLGTLGALPGGDPCDIRSAYRSASDPARAAAVRGLCLAQGVPANIIDSYTNTKTRANFTTAGNADLQAETADTFSVGVVWSPKFATPLLSRINLSIDYYDIRIKDAIGQITAPLAVSKCFNADGTNSGYALSNSYCALITREGSGLIDNVTVPKRNLSGYRTSGVDIAGDWTFNLGDVGLPEGAGRLRLSSVVNYLESFKIESLPGAGFRDYAGTIQNTQIDLFSSARPRWKATSSATWSLEPVDLSLRWRRIGEMENANNVGVVGAALGPTKAVNYFDLDAAWRASAKLELRAGVVNLADKTPPTVVTSAVGAYTTDVNTYDLIGRRFFVSLKARF